jgi:hypothetical protein
VTEALFVGRRFRVFDWATRWFWVVVLWENGRLHVGRYGPAHGRWFNALKWEPAPDRRGGEAPHD